MQATLTSKGQMTLPVAVRARSGLQAVAHLLVIVQDDEPIILKRPSSASTTSLRGLLAKPRRRQSIEEMDAAIASHLAAKHRQGAKS